MYIEKFKVRSKATEVAPSVKLIIMAYEQSRVTVDPHLETMFTLLTPQADDLSIAINHHKVKSRQAEMDLIRDAKFKGVHALVSGYQFHPNPVICKASIPVLKLFEQYGLSMINASYVVETALMDSLLGDLKEKSVAEHIENLPGVSQLIEELEESEIAFESSRLNFNLAKSQEEQLKTATEIKMELLSAVNDRLVLYLRAMAMVDEVQYGAFARVVAQIITDHNRAVKKRIGK